MPSPPAFVSERDAAAARHRLRGEQRRDVDELVERLRPDHAGLAEERVDRGVRAGERSGVRARRLAAGARRAALHREDRLRARDAARDARERARVAERLEVEHDELRVRRRPPTTRAGRSTRRPPCCRSRRTPRGRARAPPPRSSTARPSAPLCDEKPIFPVGNARGANVALRRDGGGGDAEAVRPDEARAVLAHEREQLLLALDAFGADLGEAGGDDDERATPASSASCAASSTCSPGRQMTARSTCSGISPTRA